MDIEAAKVKWESAGYSVREKEKSASPEAQTIYTSKSFEDDYEILKNGKNVSTLKESEVIERAEKMI